MVRDPLSIPPAVLAAYGISSDAAIEPITIGLINQTYRVGSLAIQRLHPIFAGEVNLDLDAITAHLAARGMITPRLVRTRDERAWVDAEGVWRALTWIDGEVHTSLRAPSLAHAAGVLVGRFHRAIADLEHTFAFGRAGVHDTARHLARLEGAIAGASGDVRAIGEAILGHARDLAPLPTTRRRIVHGDLKISNLLFDASGRGVALLDLDTLAHGILAHELGDALRSWCNPAGESAEGAIDPALFAASIEGWASQMKGHLDPDEVSSIVPGTETIALELASRFALDAIEDRYFGWDASRYPSRVAHNLARARSQLALARSIREARATLDTIVARALG